MPVVTSESWWTERANPRVWLSGRRVIGEINGERLAHIAGDRMAPATVARMLQNMRRILLERLEPMSKTLKPTQAAVLLLAAEQFEKYAELHDAKGTAEGADKARVNREFASYCRGSAAEGDWLDEPPTGEMFIYAKPNPDQENGWSVGLGYWNKISGRWADTYGAPITGACRFKRIGETPKL